MKPILQHFLLITLITITGAVGRAVPVSFSGGDGADLSMTFNESFALSLTRDSLYVRLVFDDIHVFAGDGIAPINAFSYTVNGASDPHADSLHALYDWHLTNGDLTPGDFLMPVSADTTAMGATYQFTSGQTIKTVGGWASDPASYHSSFQIYLVDLFGNRVSNIISGTIGSATPIPEPATCAALAGLAVLVAAALHRRRKAG